MYQIPEPPEITRHFVNLDDRQVHFRLAGSGPPLLLLHQSPTSSAEMVTELIEFSRTFTTLGIDTPGFGQSDRLSLDKPDLTDFARVLADVLDVLGIGETLIYGFHTGAMIGFEFARLFPERCAAVVVNGLVVFEGYELEDFLANYNFMPPTGAVGEHLPWTWARLRDQRLFFPWYRKTPDARMSFDLPDAAFQQPYVLDYFRSGDGGRAAYQAAFAYPTRARMPQIKRPVFLLNYEQDPLAPHPERLAEWPDCVGREIFNNPNSLNERARQMLLQHAPSHHATVHRQSTGKFTGVFQKDYIETDFGPVFVKFSAFGPGQPILLLHDAGASSQSLDLLAADLYRQTFDQRQIISLDMPGHGDTGMLRLPDYSVGNIVATLASVLDELQLEDTVVLAVGAGCIIAAALAAARARRVVSKLLLIDPWLFGDEERATLAESYAPDLEPRQNGQHLLSAWRFARDSELFWPWHDCKVDYALARAPEIEPAQTQARVVDALKAGAAFSRFVHGAMAYDFAGALAALEAPATVFARRGNGHEERAREVARKAPAAIYNRLPAARSEWARLILSSLSSGD